MPVVEDFDGEAIPQSSNLTIGYLPQESQLDPTKDVRGSVAEGMAAAQAHRVVGKRGDKPAVHEAAAVRMRRPGAKPDIDRLAGPTRIKRLPRIRKPAFAPVRPETYRDIRGLLTHL